MALYRFKKTRVHAQRPFFEGFFSSLITGIVTGSVDDGDALLLCAGASIAGNVRGRRVFIEGLVYGDIEAEEEVHVGPSGRVLGQMQAPRIVVAPGADVAHARKGPDSERVEEVATLPAMEDLASSIESAAIELKASVAAAEPECSGHSTDVIPDAVTEVRQPDGVAGLKPRGWRIIHY